MRLAQNSNMSIQEKVSIDLILGVLREYVEHKHPIGPEMWLDAAQKLNTLISDEHRKLYELQQEVAKKKVAYIESGDTVAKANVKLQADDIYKTAKIQEARIGQIEEMVRISKLQARMASTEMQNGS